MSQFKMLDGNSAAVEAIIQARPKVIAAYPITPQTSISEKLSEAVANKKLDANFIRVESEHTALSVVQGAMLTGVRAATATSSVGLALMHEIVCAVSGVRLPVVMPVVNRSLASPWSLWCDHQDTMAERDSGWMQFYCENVQDVYDLILCAYRIAENTKVLTPAMICLDGFFLSHSMQKILVEKQEDIDDFLGSYIRKNMYLDTKDPLVINNLTPTADNMEMRYQQLVGMQEAEKVIEDVFKDYNNKFNREHHLVEGYKTKDADLIVVSLGSSSGTAKTAVDRMRSKGIKAGALKITCYRPFPYLQVQQALGNAKKVAVLERVGNIGSQFGPLYMDICAAMQGQKLVICDYIAGLAGRDISVNTFNELFQNLNENEKSGTMKWLDLREDAMEVRRYRFNV